MTTQTQNNFISPELAARGFKEESKRRGIYRGREIVKAKYTKNTADGMAERIGRGVLGAAAFPLLFSQDFRDMTINPALKGAATEYAYEETGQEEQVAPHHLGYHPNQRNTIRAYLDKPEIRSQLRESNGHYFLPEKRRADGQITSFIFVPNGNFSKARSIKVYTAKSGKAIKNTEKLLRAIRSYCAAYSDIKEGYHKQKETLANDLVQIYQRDKQQTITLAQAKASIKQRPKTFVLDMRLGQARMYSDHDLSKRINHNSFRTGTLIKLKDDTNKEIGRIHGKDMKSQEPLEGERPFKKALPTTPDREFLPSDDGELI